MDFLSPNRFRPFRLFRIWSSEEHSDPERGASPMAENLSDASGCLEDGAVLCPHVGCKFEYIHPVKVVVNQGGSITTIVKEGTTTTEGEAASRGVTIAIYYACESGHFSVMRQQF